MSWSCGSVSSPPGTPVVWPYDVMAIHYAMFIDEALGCSPSG
ncbi:MAG: hypothetical protein QOF52_2518 [Propionibacteriaceae bacterium]|jgi:hypothetical protein|nr:hypothetical protein [Propionibacteriaceae bacterium]